MARNPDPRSHLRISEIVVGERLGSGYTSQVFRGVHRETKQIVALKVLRQEILRDKSLVGRFAREAQLLANLDHPNICRLIAQGMSDDEVPWLAMEYIDGATLETVLERRTTITQREAAIVGGSLTRALAYAQRAHGVVHRDIKPANVLIANLGDNWQITPQSRVVLTDFGLGKPQMRPHAQLTMEGDIMGTPIYLAPETAKNGENSQASDAYSLGVLLFESISGKPPFDGDSVPQILSAHIQDPIPPVAPQAAGVTQDFRRLVTSFLNKTPGKRPVLDDALAARFVAWANGSHLPCAGTLSRAGLAWLISGLLFGLLALIGIVWVLVEVL